MGVELKINCTIGERRKGQQDFGDEVWEEQR